MQDCVHNVKREHVQHQVGQVGGNSDDDHLENDDSDYDILEYDDGDHDILGDDDSDDHHLDYDKLL